VTIDEVANRLQISHGSAYEIIRSRLVFHEVCTRWVPTQLTMRLDTCQQHLDHYGNKHDAFLNKIIAVDNTWIYHCELGSKHQSMEWKHPQSPGKKKFKSQPSAGKLMLTLFGTQKAQ
jgi:hypothetical protein